MVEVLDYLGKLMKVRGDKGSGLGIISHGHRKVHDGKVWVHPYNFSGLGAAASVDVIVTPASADKKIHVEVLRSASNAGAIYLYKNPTASGGTGVGGSNLDLSNAAASPATVVHTSTIAADGTLIDGVSFSSGQGNSGGGAGDVPIEFLLTGTNKLLIRFTAVNTGTSGFIKIVVTEEDF